MRSQVPFQGISLTEYISTSFRSENPGFHDRFFPQVPRLIMECIFVNSGRINSIVGDLERYDIGLLEYEIDLRSIHGILTQGVT
jgi:hypothetical protein